MAVGSNSARAAASEPLHETSPRLSAAPTPITLVSAGHASRNAAMTSAEPSSTIATFAPLSLSRDCKASAPNSVDSGTAIAPIWKTAISATAVCGRCGMITATRSPRATPSEPSAFDSRRASRCSAA